MDKKEYYLGLDLGTNSVGWAVTDKNYNLMRAKGKDLWGIREFNEAEVAVERRTQRVARRRLQREKARIALLKSYFDDAIFEVDPNFFIRLDNSKYFKEDKDERLSTINGIFDDPDYNDKKYFKEYPTIFHLRNELIKNPEKHDVRLVFLALLNMFKHRGHFLNANLSSESGSRSISDVYTEVNEELSELTEISLPEIADYSAVLDVLSDRKFSRSVKNEKLHDLIGFDKKNKTVTTVFKLICGLSVSSSDLDENISSEDNVKICFADAGYEDKEQEILSKIGNDWFDIISLLKEIYDAGILAGILKGCDYLSESRIREYEKHKNDLKILKRIYKKHPKDYDLMFRSAEKASYSAYVKSENSGKKSRRDADDRKRESLYDSIKKTIKKWNENGQDKDILYVLEEIELGTFLPKQLTSSNGVIPNQVHLKEMRAILSNAEKYLPFLNDIDESGLKVSERIIELFRFQIPYYIGPVSEDSKKMNGNGWVVRKAPGPVLPWNFDEKIDRMATAEQFISKMTRQCSYISGEKALPKNSLKYERFRVLNEINNIKVADVPISVEIKQDIYNDLFKKGKKVTRKSLDKYLCERKVASNPAEISGIDEKINNSLSSYGKFREIFGDRIDTDPYIKMVENIIFWCTVYGESKKFLNERLIENYGERSDSLIKLSDSEIKRILGFKFSDWGRLSESFLDLNGMDKETGEVTSLIHAMWETNLNMMELINSDRFTFSETLKKKTDSSFKSLAEFEHEDLDDYYFSAPVKRMIWQTLLLIKELEQVLGNHPSRVFIEMTRKEDDKKERKASRGKQLTELYKSIKDESKEWRNEWISKINKADEDGSLRSKKLYLYYVQMGKDMYTGNPIDLHELLNDNKYDIDHIYPRHFVKDDNISNNLVLVNKETNNHKQDEYPIESGIRNNEKVRQLWNALHSAGLINDEKYKRLTRTTQFTDDEKAGFIARQLVETSQATKGVADILKELLPTPETTIVYAKASNVSDFRRDNGYLKSRLLNDLHHAQDAYLNIVVGNVYYVKFTQNPSNYIKQDLLKSGEGYHLSSMFKYDVRRGNEIAWVAPGKESRKGTLEVVDKVMHRNTPILTRMNFTGHGKIADATLYSSDKAKEKGYISIKSSDPKMLDMSKYGGLSSVATAYFFLVEHKKKNKIVRTLETIPIYMRDAIEKKPELLEKYCIKKLGLVDPDIRVRKIKLHSLININGYYGHIPGISGNQIYLRNSVNMCLSPDWNNYVHKIEKYNDTGIIDSLISVEKNTELYELLSDKHSNSIFKNRPNPVGEKLKIAKDKFMVLDVETQLGVLYQILMLSVIGNPKADLTQIGYSPSSGIMLINKDITSAQEVTLINQSVTGLYENRINLLTV